MTKSSRLGVCVFCGSRERMHNEDVWPNWLRNLYPGESSIQQVGWLSPSRDFEITVKDRPRNRVLARRVCQDECNGGWMSRLEMAMKGVMLPAILHGSETPLSGDAQHMVATWAVKTAMMIEVTGDTHRAIPQADYHFIYKNQTPPQLTEVFIGAYAGTTLPHLRWEHGAVRIAVTRGLAKITPATLADVPRGDAYTTTLVVDRVVLWVLGAPSAPEPLRLRLSTDVGHRLRRIWPPEEELFEWPPHPPFDDAALKELATSLTAAYPIL